MNKKVFGRKLSRNFGSRRALFRSLTRAIAFNGEIKTTYAKAKFFIPEVERMLNSAKKDDIAARRRILATLANDREVTDKLFEIAKVFTGRTGGYLRTINLPKRRGDAAEMVKVSWTEKIDTSKQSLAESRLGKSEKKKPIKENKEKGTVKRLLKRSKKSS
jgi:large subunit ribosomal protein L17